ncbi:putative G-protein coupled receptor 148 [Mustelus asterias]
MALLAIDASNFTVILSSIRLPNATNSSEDCSLSVKGVLPQHLDMFLISLALCLAGTLLANPLLLMVILLNKSFRQETRFLFLANILVADLIFLFLNSFIAISVATRLCMPNLLCDFAVIGRTIADFSSVLTITFMAIDTYIAVGLPLRYLSLIHLSRTVKLVIAIWILASVYPFSLLTGILAKQPALIRGRKMCLMLLSPDLYPFNRQLILGINIFLVCSILTCFSLVLYCYIMLYCKTKGSGIWDSLNSRAIMTLLIHGIVLLLYFGPCLIFSLEIVFSDSHLINTSTRMWLYNINIYIFMMIPRLLSPYLYGLRFRELAEVVKGLFIIGRHRVHAINR